MSDHDPRLVDLYDGDNPDGPDHDHYRALVRRLDARRVLDLGCGTGLLTVTLAQPGRTVVGVDPSSRMVSHARHRPGGEQVHWVHGDSRDIPGDGYDLAVMTGNVVQHILDADWVRTLADLHRVLEPDATLAFESRNPLARAWETWATEPPSSRWTPIGELREWTELDDVGLDHQGGTRVDLIFHTEFTSSGEHLTEQLTLAFRTRETLTSQLAEAGFTVRRVCGNWVGTPFTVGAPIMVVEAQRL